MLKEDTVLVPWFASAVISWDLKETFPKGSFCQHVLDGSGPRCLSEALASWCRAILCPRWGGCVLQSFMILRAGPRWVDKTTVC